MSPPMAAVLALCDGEILSLPGMLLTLAWVRHLPDRSQVHTGVQSRQPQIDGSQQCTCILSHSITTRCRAPHLTQTTDSTFFNLF